MVVKLNIGQFENILCAFEIRDIISINNGKINELKELAKSFYIGQKVWKSQSGYYVIGNVVGIDGGTISVWWDRFKDWDWYGVYNQSDILIAERMTHINLGTIYTYNADEINPYK